MSPPARAERPPRTATDVHHAVPTPDALFRDALPIVDLVVRDLARRYRLTRDDQEEFRGAMHLRLLEDDYAVLRKFEGRASLSTFLRIVITRAFLDQRVRDWGRWRPSADAVRLGAQAVDLERLLERQRLPLEEAIETLRARDATLDAQALRSLAAGLPRRVTGRRLVEESELQHLADPGEASDHLVEDADVARVGSQIAAALREATEALPPRARLLLRLRFEQGSSIADLSRVLGEPQKPLYREFERLLRDLRMALEARGVSLDHLHAVLGQAAGKLDGALAPEPAMKAGDSSVSIPVRPDDGGAVAER